MYTKDHKIIRFSMVLLFLALMIVYIIRYQIKGNELKKTLENEEVGTDIPVVSMYGEESEFEYKEEISDHKKEETSGSQAETGTKTETKSMTGKDTIRMLSGTSIYYGKIEIIEKLGIKYQYALADGTGTWFIYLGTPSYDFASIARALKGTIYTMATEQELIDNKLFGNKVVFINLPEYKDKQVIMLIYMPNGIRLVQIAYDNYHKSKSYLKSLFID